MEAAHAEEEVRACDVVAGRAEGHENAGFSVAVLAQEVGESERVDGHATTVALPPDPSRWEKRGLCATQICSVDSGKWAP